MNTKPPILYWFKNDLRLHDNEALHMAVETGVPIIAVYFIDPDAYRFLDLGFRKADEVRYQFLVQCLKDLREKLGNLGGDLLIVQGNTAEQISKLVRRHDVSEIYAEEEHAEEELAMVEKVADALPASCTLKCYWGPTLYHRDDIPYAINKIPLVSKTYRIKTTKETEVRECLSDIKKIDFHPLSDYGDLPDFGAVAPDTESTAADTIASSIAASQKTEPYLKGGESEALARLQHYFYETEQLTAYKWTRNKSLGMDYSSKFSAYLAHGCLSPRYIYHEVKKYEKETKKNYGTWWFIFELVWRDFFIFRHMRVGGKLYAKNGFKGKKVHFEDSTELFERWYEGKTGIPFVDAHMRKLNQTGYMSNRGRVNCSSFLIHDYKVDWRWGAAYFESKLIDYDVSVNWMNWHMQAFEIWYTNPIHQSQKYKEQEYIRKWVPELAHLNDVETLLPWETEVKDYPRPVEIYKKWQRSINTIKKSGSKK